jgi:hypothetical protein
MRKLKIIEHMSLDGVIQHSADGGDFPYGEWTVPYRTAEGRQVMLAAHGECFDLLLGRRLYDSWSAFWPQAPSSPMADRLNAARSSSSPTVPRVSRGVRRRPWDRTSPKVCAASRHRTARSLELVSTEAMSSGVILSTYTPAGPLRAA